MCGIQGIQAVYLGKDLSVFVTQEKVFKQVVSVGAGHFLFKLVFVGDKGAVVCARFLAVCFRIGHGVAHFVGKAAPRRIVVYILFAIRSLIGILDGFHKVTGFLIFFKGYLAHQGCPAVPAEDYRAVPGKGGTDRRIGFSIYRKAGLEIVEPARKIRALLISLPVRYPCLAPSRSLVSSVATPEIASRHTMLPSLSVLAEKPVFQQS